MSGATAAPTDSSATTGPVGTNLVAVGFKNSQLVPKRNLETKLLLRSLICDSYALP
jgi:hypothetical protein